MFPERDVPQPADAPMSIRTHSNPPVLTPPVCVWGGVQGQAGPSTRLDNSSWVTGKGVPCQSPACRVSCAAVGSVPC